MCMGRHRGLRGVNKRHKSDGGKPKVKEKTSADRAKSENA